MNLGLKLEEVRDEVLNLLGSGMASEEVQGGAPSAAGREANGH